MSVLQLSYDYAGHFLLCRVRQRKGAVGCEQTQVPYKIGKSTLACMIGENVRIPPVNFYTNVAQSDTGTGLLLAFNQVKTLAGTLMAVQHYDLPF